MKIEKIKNKLKRYREMRDKMIDKVQASGKSEAEYYNYHGGWTVGYLTAHVTLFEDLLEHYEKEQNTENK